MFKAYPTTIIIIDEPELCGMDTCLDENYAFFHPFKHGKSGDISDQVFIRAKKLTIGENVHIAPGVKIVGNGEVIIGNGVTIAPNVVIYSSRPKLSPVFPSGNKYGSAFMQVTGKVVIGDDVFIGAGAVLGVNEYGDDLYIKSGTIIRALSYFDGE